MRRAGRGGTALHGIQHRKKGEAGGGPQFLPRNRVRPVDLRRIARRSTAQAHRRWPDAEVLIPAACQPYGVRSIILNHEPVLLDPTPVCGVVGNAKALYFRMLGM